jgi:hypothetical protein
VADKNTSKPANGPKPAAPKKPKKPRTKDALAHATEAARKLLKLQKRERNFRAKADKLAAEVQAIVNAASPEVRALMAALESSPLVAATTEEVPTTA